MENINLLTYRDLESRGFGSRVTIWRKVRDNKFPQPIIICGAPRWRESTIMEWIESLEIELVTHKQPIQSTG